MRALVSVVMAALGLVAIGYGRLELAAILIGFAAVLDVRALVSSARDAVAGIAIAAIGCLLVVAVIALWKPAVKEAAHVILVVGFGFYVIARGVAWVFVGARETEERAYAAVARQTEDEPRDDLAAERDFAAFHCDRCDSFREWASLIEVRECEACERPFNATTTGPSCPDCRQVSTSVLTGRGCPECLEAVDRY